MHVKLKLTVDSGCNFLSRCAQVRRSGDKHKTHSGRIEGVLLQFSLVYRRHGQWLYLLVLLWPGQEMRKQAQNSQWKDWRGAELS